jgi:hypothetical protein
VTQTLFFLHVAPKVVVQEVKSGIVQDTDKRSSSYELLYQGILFGKRGGGGGGWIHQIYFKTEGRENGYLVAVAS